MDRTVEILDRLIEKYSNFSDDEFIRNFVDEMKLLKANIEKKRIKK
ncbi:MAG: hypothetical protein ACUVXI_14390 [bacterium]